MVEVGVGTAVKGNETKRNQALNRLCVCERVCVQERVQSACVCRCADLALLSEGCIRVACRKGHRTTVVSKKKKKKSRRAIRIRIFSSRQKGLKERGRGYMGGGESGVCQWKQKNSRIRGG